MKDILLNIPGYSGYQASNFGYIYSKKSNRVLKSHFNEKGYLRVCLYVDGKPTTQKVHRLVALAFLENPKNYKEVNHKDGNKTNNCVENLEWCTHLENMRHAYQNNLIPPKKANRTSYSAKIVFQFDLNGTLINKYNSVSQASKETGYSIQSISRYCNNKRKCKDYIWRYAD